MNVVCKKCGKEIDYNLPYCEECTMKIMERAQETGKPCTKRWIGKPLGDLMKKDVETESVEYVLIESDYHPDPASGPMFQTRLRQVNHANFLAQAAYAQAFMGAYHRELIMLLDSENVGYEFIGHALVIRDPLEKLPDNVLEKLRIDRFGKVTYKGSWVAHPCENGCEHAKSISMEEHEPTVDWCINTCRVPGWPSWIEKQRIAGQLKVLDYDVKL